MTKWDETPQRRSALLNAPLQRSLTDEKWDCRTAGIYTRCYCCNEVIYYENVDDNSEASHLTPQRDGVDHSPYNVRMSCRSCNRKAGTKTPFEHASECIAVGLPGNYANGLAMKEKITTLEEAQNIYTRDYLGNTNSNCCIL